MFCSTYGYSCIDKSRICISPVVPTGTHASDKSHICISLVVPKGTLVSINKYKLGST